MIDCHVHIERGAYTEEWINEFVKEAEEKGIKKLYLLEHSHRFIQFKSIYETVVAETSCGEYQKEWLQRKCSINLEDYKNLVKKMRKVKFPIEVYFGLEICYFSDKEEEIKALVSDFDWDFLTGSIHWIDGWGFDHPVTKETWEKKDVDNIYLKYYELMIKLVESKIFTILAHPDSIKCFDYYPKIDLSNLYNKLAISLKENNVKAEFSCGLYNNYKHNEMGPNRELLSALIYNKVDIITASDAHKPEDVGRSIKEAYNLVTFQY